MARKKGINKEKRHKKRKNIYFFLEGEENCSEHLYLVKYYNSFRGRAIDIGFYFFPSGSGDWKNIKREIDKKMKKCDHDNIEIWCILDKDENNLENIQKNCNQNDYKLVFSNMSFEVWLLYHFYEYSKIGECDNKKYIKKLEKKLGKKYKKCNGIEITEKERDFAIQNSKVIYQNYKKLGISLDEMKNCTNFYEVIEKIKNSFKEFSIK